MKGGFYCPHCNTCNACSCETCKPFIEEGEYVNQWTEDGEALICSKCKQVYTPDQALEEEYQHRKTNQPYE